MMKHFSLKLESSTFPYMVSYVLAFILFTAMWPTIDLRAQETARHQNTDFNKLSEEFLKATLLQENTDHFIQQLEQIELNSLSAYLDTDKKRIAFWVNIYNAFIQVLLQEDPSRINKKGQFFSKKQIALFGRKISFDKIEHHILRRSQWKFGLGNFQLSFRPKFEKMLRVDKKESRIHFVLNCGAKSCPTTKVLTLDNLEQQLKESTSEFLRATTTYNESENTVYITALFMWFRGDFGNKKGIKEMLRLENLIPPDSNPKLKSTPYDWTLDLKNWKDWR